MACYYGLRTLFVVFGQRFPAANFFWLTRDADVGASVLGACDTTIGPL
jgi:hypothetical protein